MQVILFLILFALGKATSLLLYRMCWMNASSGNISRLGTLATMLGRPLPWLAHLAFAASAYRLSWDDWPLLHGFAVMLTGLLALGAIGRFGSADLGRYFIADRILVLALAVSLVFAAVSLSVSDRLLLPPIRRFFVATRTRIFQSSWI